MKDGRRDRATDLVILPDHAFLTAIRAHLRVEREDSATSVTEVRILPHRQKDATVQHARTRSDDRPKHAAVTLVESDEARCTRRRNVHARLVDAVRRAKEQCIPDGKNRTIRGFVRKDTEVLAKVDLPDELGTAIVWNQAAHFALRRDVVETVVREQRWTRGRRQKEALDASLE